MLKWILVLAVVAVLGGLMFSGISLGPSQAPVIILVLVVAFVALAFVARTTVYKRMKK